MTEETNKQWGDEHLAIIKQKIAQARDLYHQLKQKQSEETITLSPRDFLLRGTKRIRAELAAYKKKCDEEYTGLVNQYLKETSPIQTGSVYEIKDGKRKKYVRFVVYETSIEIFDDMILTRIGGWWLDNENVPAKWATLTTDGVINPTELILSADQTHLPHPGTKYAA